MSLESKIPIFLVTGFLGCGKTSFLSNFLKRYDKERKIAVVQNEFAPLNIDSEILSSISGRFKIEELQTGSIFCQCLFPHFKDVLVELTDKNIDTVLIEASGIADPLSVWKILDDKRLSDRYYIAQLISLVDASRFLNILINLKSVYHQIQVSDTILVNKCDLLSDTSEASAEEELERIESRISEVNPLVKVYRCVRGNIALDNIINWNMQNRMVNAGFKMVLPKLQKKSDNVFMSDVFSSPLPVSHKMLDRFTKSLNDANSEKESIMRVKGYVLMDNGDRFIYQFTPNSFELIPYYGNVVKTELIAIGYEKPRFNILLSKS